MIPRFKVTSVCGLKSAMTALGHGHLFDRFQTNMAAVSRHGHAYVSNIMNAVSLDVGPCHFDVADGDRSSRCLYGGSRGHVSRQQALHVRGRRQDGRLASGRWASL
ncbi:hypothetical protein MTO96_018426 [Rhipicephalus appendiculatus]